MTTASRRAVPSRAGVLATSAWTEVIVTSALNRDRTSLVRRRARRAVHRRRLALALVAVAGISAAPSLRAQETERSGRSVQAGARLFRSKGCLECHAIGGGGVGPDLRTVAGSRTLFGFAAALWNHLPTMQAMMRSRGTSPPRLASWEAGDLVAFLTWIDYFDEPGDSARGGTVFRDKNCIDCHQVRNVGGVRGPALDAEAVGTPIMLAAAMWNHLPAMMRAQTERGLHQAQFTGAELRDLVAFVADDRSSLLRAPLVVMPGESEHGHAVFVDKGCIACHSIRGAGGSVGPDLGRDVRYDNVLDLAAALWNKGPRMVLLMRQRGIDPPDVAPQEMADLVAFFYAGRYFGDAGSAERGRALFGSARCAGCHGQRDEVSRGAQLGSPAGVVAAVWNHVLADRALDERADAWPQVTAEDMADLSAYLDDVGGS
jgi:mono/diheme cytochrome c family protein